MERSEVALSNKTEIFRRNTATGSARQTKVFLELKARGNAIKEVVEAKTYSNHVFATAKLTIYLARLPATCSHLKGH